MRGAIWIFHSTLAPARGAGQGAKTHAFWQVGSMVKELLRGMGSRWLPLSGGEVAPMSKNAGKFDWSAANRQILQAVGVEQTAIEWGVQFSADSASSSGWRECHAVDRADRNPSAAICVDPTSAAYGIYKDLGGGNTKALRFWDLGVLTGQFIDWKECQADLANKAGVELPNKQAAEKSEKRKKPQTLEEVIQQQLPELDKTGGHLTYAYAHLFARSRAGVSPESVLAAGGMAGTWLPRTSGQQAVIAFYGYRPGEWSRPSAVLLYPRDGNLFPAARTLKERKTHLLGKSRDSLIVVGGKEKLDAAQTVWLTEGLPDALALSAILPDGHVAVTNTHGAGTFDSALSSAFSGKSVRIVMDCDTAGAKGADIRKHALVPECYGLKEMKIVQLPYPMQEEHGRDLRDWIVEGHSFVELEALADASTICCLGKKEIDVTFDEYEVTDDAEEALAQDDSIYQRHGLLVHIIFDRAGNDKICRDPIQPRIVPVTPPLIRDRLTAQADFYKTSSSSGESTKQEPKRQQISVPFWCVQALAARGNYQHARYLDGIAGFPVLLADGSVLYKSGYDPASHLYLSNATPEVVLSTSISQEEANLAAQIILDVVCDFPFEKPEHKVAWLASLLTALSRMAFHGPAPLFVIDANIRGSGKSLLADITSLIVQGCCVARMSNPHDDEEARKRITAIAIEGDPLVLIDNVIGMLGCAALDAALTGSIWKDRILGRSETVSMPLRTTWIATGNNIVLNADTSRRVLHIRLQSPLEQPESRSGFRHSDLKAYVLSKRSDLLTAALTILRGFILAGQPMQPMAPWGSYESWSSLVRQAIVWAGLPDPALTRQEFVQAGDREAMALRALVENWHMADKNGQGLTAREIRELLQQDDSNELAPFRDAIFDLCPPPGTASMPTTRQIGNKLGHLRMRVVAGKALDYKTGAGRTRRWFVTEAATRETHNESGTSDSSATNDSETSTYDATTDAKSTARENTEEESKPSHWSHQSHSPSPDFSDPGHNSKHVEIVL